MIVLGVDPDLHNTGLAIVDVEPDKPPVLVGVGIVRVPGQIRGNKIKGKQAVICMAAAMWPIMRDLIEDFAVSRIVVEGQQIYTGRGKARTMDILNLALVAGAALGCSYGVHWIECPTPVQWKGSVPKEIHQTRICNYLGLEVVDGIPQLPTSYEVRIFGNVTKTNWSHAIDAAGLALWGGKK